MRDSPILGGENMTTEQYEITEQMVIELKKLLDKETDPEMIEFRKEIYGTFKLKYELQQLQK